MKKIGLLLLIILSGITGLEAQNFSEIIKVVASDRAVNDYFGYSISISGDYAIVGAPLEQEDATGGNTLSQAGSAYIFKKDEGGIDNWGQVAKLVAFDRAANDWFGWSVSISGDYAVVGVVLESEDELAGDTKFFAGSAYVFKKDQGGVDNWGQIKKIVASDRDEGDSFGQSVSISGDYIIVGAHYEDEDATGGNTLQTSGAAYIFKKNQGGTDNWGQVKKVVASDRASEANFGYSVSITNDYVIVGAYGHNENTELNAGAAYIFEKNQGGIDNWGEVKKVTASNKLANDNFGFSVSIFGDYAVVGAYREDEDGNDNNTKSNAGSAYIFKKDEGGINNWGQVQKIVSSDRAADDYFGHSVSISGDYVDVGAFQEDEDAFGNNTLSIAGSAYIFKKDEGGTDNWGEVKKIVASNRASNDFFAFGVAIADDYIITGAYREDEDAIGGNTLSEAGAAYIFKNQPVLPVELTDFTANRQDNQTNLLEWETVTEDSNKGFEVQRSRNGENWQALDFVTGNGTTLEVQNYRYVDEEPINGLNYYRLKQIDFDGNYEYSKIVKVEVKLTYRDIIIYPNPVQDQLIIQGERDIEGIVIYNSIGQQIRQKEINGQQNQYINVEDLKEGIYTIQLFFTNGELATKQFIK